MEILRAENLTFTYSGHRAFALRDISFKVRSGEFVTICGHSGSGKSTLLSLLKPSVAPSGELCGTLCFSGRPLSELSPREEAESIGFVRQDPERQIVTDKVWHELAFGLENLGLSQNEIRVRVAETAAFFGIDEWFYKDTSELSGGEKQLLNLAAVMVMRPQVILLDEPTSRLDPIAAESFISVLSKINRELGTTIVICEHRLDEILPCSDRLLMLSEGELMLFSSPREAAMSICKSDADAALSMPVAARVHAALGAAPPCPLSVREGRDFLGTYMQENTPDLQLIPVDGEAEEREQVLKLSEICFRYEKSSPDILKNLSLSLRQGELLAIIGGNGAGKSTLLSVIAGLSKPHHGKVSCKKRAALLPQDPTSLFTCDTLASDLKTISSDYEKEAKLCHIGHLLSRHPLDLSGGELQRAALAKVLLTDADILLLDEPTKGLDAQLRKNFGALLKSLTESGKSIVIISHDIDFCAEYADRVCMLFDGEISAADAPRRFFSRNSFYTTTASRMARSLLPGAVLADDIIAAFGKSSPQRPKLQPQKTEPTSELLKAAPAPEKRKITRSGALSLAISIALMLATVLFGLYALEDKRYYIISLLVIIEAMIPFFVNLESRRASSRELALIAVMTTLAVIGRAAFYMVPQFKPLVAIVIISGIALGAESGFFVGVLSAFVSNMLFGQGPWTPWQMAALGLCGVLSGLLFRKGWLSRKALPISIFGGFCVLIVYGIIVNTSSLLMWQPHPTLGMLILTIVQGVPFDVIHAVGTFVFLLLLAEPTIRKISRVKDKYSL
ncbi:MAG: ATP-binding cassette domain-containing protein [Oscillospiraceae bacterium]|nr:ATP-binding cassette domain-containing protein [Oscillospiraceae bacterium]